MKNLNKTKVTSPFHRKLNILKKLTLINYNKSLESINIAF